MREAHAVTYVLCVFVGVCGCVSAPHAPLECTREATLAASEQNPMSPLPQTMAVSAFDLVSICDEPKTKKQNTRTVDFPLALIITREHSHLVRLRNASPAATRKRRPPLCARSPKARSLILFSGAALSNAIVQCHPCACGSTDLFHLLQWRRRTFETAGGTRIICFAMITGTRVDFLHFCATNRKLRFSALSQPTVFIY